MMESVSSFGACGVFLRRPVLESVRSSGGESSLHSLTWPSSSSFVGRVVSLTCPVLQSLSSLSVSGVSLTHPVLKYLLSFVGKGISLTRPVLVCVSSRVGGEFLLYAP